MSNPVSEWVRAFAAPGWFRAAVAALVLVAFGVGIGLRVGSPTLPVAGTPAPGGPVTTGAAGLNLPPLPVEGRRLMPEPPAPAGQTPTFSGEPDADQPPLATTLPAGESSASLSAAGAEANGPVAVVVEPSSPPPDPDLPAGSAPATTGGGSPTPPRTWHEIQDDLFGER